MINSVILMGRLTADPKLSTTTSGKSVCSFSVAVDRGYTDQNGARQADFINIVAWSGTAEFVERYFLKGNMIAVTGKIQTRNYQDKNGNKRTAFEVVASEVSFCGEKAKTNNQTSTEGKPLTESYSNASASDFDDIVNDEDLPF